MANPANVLELQVPRIIEIDVGLREAVRQQRPGRRPVSVGGKRELAGRHVSHRLAASRSVSTCDTVIEGALARPDSVHPRVILNDAGRVTGRITLSETIRGPVQSCSLGYWVSAGDNGRGLATAAVGEVVAVAFSDLGLHRVQAGTLAHNVRSQRVLERNGFTRIGMAPAYLNIAGRWQDHILFQVVAEQAG